jgi:predicted SnoaL-like aldol condensation-catalyzing enzyme
MLHFLTRTRKQSSGGVGVGSELVVVQEAERLGYSVDVGRGGSATMSEQEEDNNKAIVYRFYEEVWNKGNMALFDELITPTFVNHGAGSERGSDREAFKRTIEKVRSELNFRHVVEELVAEGDTVVARLTGHGEIDREGPDSSLTREQFTGMGAVIWKLHNGQMTERWAFWEPV